MKISPSSRESMFAYLDNGPQCIVALSSNGYPIQVNNTFERLMGPLFKFTSYPLADAATEKDDGNEQMRNAITSISSLGGSQRLRNIEMLTLSDGLPIRKHFDWTIGQGDDETVILFGDKCNEQDETKIAHDAELIDFFDNAPIALHWLSGDGIVLWANKTEMNVLGYTAEEYIGHPIMNFCPDEQSLVLEIFKQLGSGNSIKDVPVRFRTKEGKLVHLLIDSNIRYNPDGSFGHTRCFIRDDTGRKMQEARAKLLLEETSRSLICMENFMSRTLHHIRTPLHVMQNTGDLIREKFRSDEVVKTMPSEANECIQLLEESNHHIRETLVMVENMLDLAKFEQGAVIETKSKILDIRSFGVDAIMKAPSPQKGTSMCLMLEEGGPSVVTSDLKVLDQVLTMLLRNAVSNTKKGQIIFSIGTVDNQCTFTVKTISDEIQDIGALAEAGKCGTLPQIFQQYRQKLSEDDIIDFGKAENLRMAIESSMSNFKTDRIGLALSLTYHLVSSLGGDLRYLAEGGSTKYWFSLPERLSRNAILTGKVLRAEKIVKIISQAAVEKKRSLTPGKEEIVRNPAKRFKEEEITPTPKVTNEAIVTKGAFQAHNLPLVLIAEDTPICARLLCKMLNNMKCATAKAENGKLAVDMLRDACPGTYSLVLMDLRMPVMDGFDATRIIKEELKLDVPVVALTGESCSTVKDRCDKIGFDDFCTKPLKKKRLLEIVNHYIMSVSCDKSGNQSEESS